ncbi:MAG: hypothetical protein ABIL58_21175 [Pseudomonadota bacterium]
MINKSCTTEDLLNALKGKSLMDAISLVEREATRVEPKAYRNGTVGSTDLCTEALKATIMYLRYGVRSSKLPENMLTAAIAARDINA